MGGLTPHVKKNQPAVRSEELPELLRAIATYDKLGQRQTLLAPQLMVLTFVRTGELIGARWSEIGPEAGLWIIPAERMKARTEHLVPLARQAVAILQELKALGGGSRFVFPRRNRDKPIINNTMLFALYRLDHKGRMTGHGFRAVVSTVLNEQGWRADVIERQLAHCERNEVRGAYNQPRRVPARARPHDAGLGRAACPHLRGRPAAVPQVWR